MFGGCGGYRIDDGCLTFCTSLCLVPLSRLTRNCEGRISRGPWRGGSRTEASGGLPAVLDAGADALCPEGIALEENRGAGRTGKRGPGEWDLSPVHHSVDLAAGPDHTVGPKEIIANPNAPVFVDVIADFQ